MLELLALITYLGAIAADAEEQRRRQIALPLTLASVAFPKLSHRLRAGHIWERGEQVPMTLQPTAEITYFASGSSRPAHIRGFATIGQPIGVVAGELSPAGMKALERLAHMQMDIFVDSGAFNEVRSGIEPDWNMVLEVYRRLALEVGDWLHVVAPDKIGDQQETLRRMRRYGPRILEAAKFDAEVFIPLQGGELPLDVFEEAALQAIDVPDKLSYLFVPAFPLKAAHLPIQQVMDYVSRWQPRRVHLLGLGPKRRAEKGRPSGQQLIQMILAASPYTEISLDSNLITATSGMTGGPAKGPRVLGGARALLREAGAAPGQVQRYSIPIAWPEEHARAIEERGPRARHMTGVPEPVKELQQIYTERWEEQLERAKTMPRKRRKKKPEEFGWLFGLDELGT